MKTRVLAIAYLSSVTVLNGAAVNFDNYISSQDNDLMNLFHVHGPQISQVQAGGISGGAVQSMPQAHAAIYMPSALRNSPGDTFTVSGLFKLATTPVRNTSGSVGFVPRPDMPLLEPYFPGYRTGFAATFNADYFQIQSDSGGLGYASPAVSLSLVSGDWYALTLVGIHNPGGDFTLTSTLHNFGATGTETPMLIATTSLTRPNPLMAGTPAMFAGFSTFVANQGTTLIDNFASDGVVVVPEPGTVTLLLLGLSIVGALRFRRQNRG